MVSYTALRAQAHRICSDYFLALKGTRKSHTSESHLARVRFAYYEYNWHCRIRMLNAFKINLCSSNRIKLCSLAAEPSTQYGDRNSNTHPSKRVFGALCYLGLPVRPLTSPGQSDSISSPASAAA